MSFCTKCGQQLQPNEIHTCVSPEQPSVNATLSSSTPSTPSPILTTARDHLANVDKHKILNLMKNPMSALQLRSESDLLYGVLGLVVSLLGFVLWAWSFKHQLIKLMILGFGSLINDEKESYREASEYLPIVNHMLLLGLISLIVLVGITLLLGNKMGLHKLHWKDSMVQLGGLQLISGIGFIVAALMMFISIKLSFVLLFTTLLATLALTLVAGIEMFRIHRDRIALFIGLVVLIQVCAILVVFNSFGSELIEEAQRISRNLF